MHAIEFLRERRTESEPIYALYGDDAYLRRESLRAIVRAALGPDAEEQAVARFAGDKATPLADVLDELRTLPFLVRARVVIVEDADPFVTAHRKELEAYAEHPARTGVLVLSVKAWPSNTKLAKLVSKAGLALECKSPNERELPDLLVELAQSRFEAKLDKNAAKLLLELVGPEFSLLVPEIEKLATYVGERAKIGRDDVARMVGAGRVETIWKTLEAATSGGATEAITLLDLLLSSGENPVGLLAAISASLRKLHHAGALRMAHKSIDDACKEAGIPTYPGAIQSTLRQHKHLGSERVDNLADWLLRADLDLKGSSSLSPRVILERLLLRLAQPREEVTQ
jgi:DNA polymerase III subunit delta